MPRLSLWSATQGANYKYFDKVAREMFVVGGTDLYVHKYAGTNNPTNNDLTLPTYDTVSPTNIQDLLFLENRDRVYDQNIYRLRGHYNVQNLDFDLSQFGLFLSSDIIFLTVHYNDMLDIIGRKLMVGDVFELPHLEDYHPLDTTIPVGLRRYYQITDANYASEGFSPTWYPHLWRLKCEPLVNTQEFQDILSAPINTDNYTGDWNSTSGYQPGYTVKYGNTIYTPVKPVPPGVAPPNPEYWAVSTEQTLSDIVTTYNQNLAINQAVIEEAKRMLPLSGYNTTNLYVAPTMLDNQPATPQNVVVPYAGQPIAVGVVEYISNPLFRFASAVVRLLPGGPNNAVVPNPFAIITMETAQIAPQTTPSGSGRVFSDIGLVVYPTSPPNGNSWTIPYGTADNTYSFADQYVETISTANDVRQNSTVISLQNDLLNNNTDGLVITATVYSANGTPTLIFPAGTTIVAYDSVAKTITASNPTQGDLPAGTPIFVSYDFNATADQLMDYRSDCDPAFQFIKRSSPRNFGYLNGYLVGDGTAPNGEPYGSGTQFPTNAVVGDYFLRVDYLPQQLFRFDGYIWVLISQNVRTDTGFTADDKSLLSGFINDAGQTPTSSGNTVPTLQGLSGILGANPD